MESTLNDKVLPHNIEAEQAVLGALMLNWDAMAEVAVKLKADDFYSLHNQLIYDTMLSMYNKTERVDTLSLSDKLNAMGKMEQAGGTAYIASLTDTVPSAANIENYVNMVLDRSTRRSLIKASSEIRASSFVLSQDSAHIVEEAEKKIFALAQLNESTVIHNMKDIMVKDISIIQQRNASKNQFTGVPSGFSKLDIMTSGFQDSELIILGARPSIGKTALALSMMQNIALERKIPCGFFSLEMPYEAIGMRLLSMEAHVDMGRLRNGFIRNNEVNAVQAAASRWFEAPLYTVDVPNMRLLELRAMARRMKDKYDVKIIFIDYIGLVTTENPNAPVYEQVSEISKSLKALARELRIPIVALSQVARAAEGEPPNLAQLRGSGSVEQDADVVMFIHRDRFANKDQPTQEAQIILAKQRNGPTGNIDIRFVPAFSAFVNNMEGDGENQ